MSLVPLSLLEAFFLFPLEYCHLNKVTKLKKLNVFVKMQRKGGTIILREHGDSWVKDFVDNSRTN